MNRNVSETAVDRLIALALDEPGKPGAQAAAAATPAEMEPMALLDDPSQLSLRELEHSPMWKTLLQFRSFLPLVSRLLEADSPTRAITVLSSEMRQSVGELQGSQRETRLAVQDHALQLKHFEESITKAQETTERHAFELSELNEDVKSMHTLVKRVTGIMVTLLVALIVLVVVLLVRLPHLIGH
ncbi:MAG TPA: hypothetical protein VGG42_13535 [Acidobacteriaceae bacterium]